MGLSEEKKQRKRKRLMESAFQLFTTKGFAGTSIEDIAKKAGVAKGTFYLYFKDKYDLHEILVLHKSEQLFLHALDCSGYESETGKVDKLLAIADDILTQLQEDRWLLQFFNWERSWSSFRRTMELLGTNYRPVFEDIFGVGALEDVGGRVEIFTILELVLSTCRSVILESDPVDLETFRPFLHRTIRAVAGSFQAA